MTYIAPLLHFKMENSESKNSDEKDPMRDSLMSGSESDDSDGLRHSKMASPDDAEGENNEDTDQTEKAFPSESGANSLELELDLWQGQFDFSATDPDFYDSVFRCSCPAGPLLSECPTTNSAVPFVRDVIKTVQMLQQQVGVLAENQVNTDDRFSRTKHDNSALQARVMMLEEQLRETELRGEERLSDEQKRNREMIGRVEREKTLTVENYAMKHATIENEKTHMSEDLSRLKDNLQKSLMEKSELVGRLSEADLNSESLRVDNSRLVENNRRDKEELKVERERGSQVIEELRCEIERLRAVEEAYRKRAPSTDSSITADMDAQIKQLNDQNKQLQEQLEEVQAQLLTSRLEEGRTLLSTTSNSLAAELDQMNSQEDAQFSSEQEKLRKSVKDYQEENQQLRNYIDEILLNIVENYPQLLEVKQK